MKTTKEKYKRLEILLYGLIPVSGVYIFYGWKAGSIALWIMVWILMLFSYYFDED